MNEMGQKIPKGYKRTEIGIIPEDWEVKRLGEVFKIKSGETKPCDTGKYGKFPIYGGNGILGYSNKHNFNKTILIIGRVGEYCGSILLARKGWVTDNALFTTSFFKNLSFDFLYYLLIYKNLNKYSSESGQPLLTQSIIYDILIPLPPLPEQKAIAKVLSDFDQLIESLDKLIEKNKLIKKGVMQQLLTGKKRLPGFTGKWVRKRLGEIGEITGAGIDKKINKNEIPVRLLNYMDVYKKDFLYDSEINFWTTTSKTKIEQCAIKEGDIFFTPSSELQTDIAISAVAMEDFKDVVYSYHIIRFRLRENWDLKFRTYIFKTKEFLEQAERLAEGSGKRYVISLKKFRELEITYPSDITEQHAIAQILSDMDTEIDALKRKKQKYERMKKGAMELLLTGKIRLKDHINEVLT